MGCLGALACAFSAAALAGCRLCRDLARGRAPFGDHQRRLSAGRDERADVDRVGLAVLADPAVGPAVGVAAGIGAHGFDADDRGAQMLARQRLHVALQPPGQRRDHVAGHGRWRRQRHLRAPADADELHRRRRAAFGAFAQGRLGHHHRVETLQQGSAASLCLLQLLRRPGQAEDPASVAALSGSSRGHWAVLAASGAAGAADGDCGPAAAGPAFTGAAFCANAPGAASTQNAAATAQRLPVIKNWPLVTPLRARLIPPRIELEFPS